MTVIEKATSGFPIFVIDTNNSSGANLANANGVSQIRPNQTCNPELSNPTLSQYFKVACFSQPAPADCHPAGTPCYRVRMTVNDLSLTPPAPDAFAVWLTQWLVPAAIAGDTWPDTASGTARAL